jgi:acetate kinase
MIPRAAFAVDHFVYRVGLNAGMLAAALGGLDAFVFTAGVGENSPAIRAGSRSRHVIPCRAASPMRRETGS